MKVLRNFIMFVFLIFLSFVCSVIAQIVPYADIDPILLDTYAVYSKGYVILSTSTSIYSGDVGSNDDFIAGITSRVYNNIRVINDLVLMSKAQMYGNVVIGGKLKQSPGSAINGIVETGLPGLDPYEFNVENFFHGDKNITVPIKDSINLDPGRYKDVLIKTEGTLTLSTGTYFFYTLVAQNKSKIQFELTNGPVIINIVNKLNMMNKSKAEIISDMGDPGQILFNIRGDSYYQCFWTQPSKAALGHYVEFSGTIIAPETIVSIGSKAVVNGAVYAKNITTGVSSSFTFMPFGRPVQDGIIAKRVADDSEEIAEEDHIIPVEFSLPQNYPNPFNPVTTITYIIPAGVTDRVAINVYDSRGALVKTLVDQFGSPGMYSVVWDGTDTTGNRVSSGVYIYTIQAGEYRKSNKMMLMR